MLEQKVPDIARIDYSIDGWRMHAPRAPISDVTVVFGDDVVAEEINIVEDDCFTPSSLLNPFLPA